ncbi:MAG: metalloregulator ArsR/SmtB family transcription factor [Albidovulum sp.]
MAYQDSLTALADPMRRQIFEHLAAQPMSVGDLAGRVPVSRPAVSQHLKVLSDAGLLTVAAEGTRRIYTANPDAIAALRNYLDTLWSEVLAGFAAKIEKDGTNDQTDC